MALTPLLWQTALPGEEGGSCLMRDLGPEANRRLMAAFPERTPWMWMPRTSPRGGARPPSLRPGGGRRCGGRSAEGAPSGPVRGEQEGPPPAQSAGGDVQDLAGIDAARRQVVRGLEPVHRGAVVVGDGPQGIALPDLVRRRPAASDDADAVAWAWPRPAARGRRSYPPRTRSTAWGNTATWKWGG